MKQWVRLLLCVQSIQIQFRHPMWLPKSSLKEPKSSPEHCSVCPNNQKPTKGHLVYWDEEGGCPEIQGNPHTVLASYLLFSTWFKSFP